jgi:XTP/dITP diphosphohydrolase
MELLLATRNRGKIGEMSRILQVPGIRLLCLDDFPSAPEAQETGAGFGENALIKARTAAHHSGLPSLADDSGLVVDALGGRPGIYSARYAGPEAGDRGNIEKLLKELAGVPPGERVARFVCHAALVFQERAYQAEGRLEGLITTEPRGTGGFGYDPVFLLPERDLTLAELAPEEKDRTSHRARALQKLKPLLLQLAKKADGG